MIYTEQVFTAEPASQNCLAALQNGDFHHTIHIDIFAVQLGITQFPEHVSVPILLVQGKEGDWLSHLSVLSKFGQTSLILIIK